MHAEFKYVQGNEEVSREISVVCRIRPLNAKEIRERSDVCTNVRLLPSPDISTHRVLHKPAQYTRVVHLF